MENNYCSICLKNIETTQITTNCSHIYHEKCIERWAIIQWELDDSYISCPMCRNNIKDDCTRFINKMYLLRLIKTMDYKQLICLYNYMDPIHKDNKEIAIALITQNSMMHNHIAEKFKYINEIIVIIIKDLRIPFDALSPENRDDEYIVNYALSFDYYDIFDLISVRLQQNIDIVCKIIDIEISRDNYGTYQQTYRKLSPELRNNKQFIIEMLMRNHINYPGDIPQIYWDDYDIILVAVQQDKTVFKVLPAKFMSNLTIIETVLHDNHDVEEIVELISTDVKNNKENILKLVNVNHRILEYLHITQLDDLNIIQKAVGKNGINIQYASYRLRQDFALIKKAVQNNGFALRYAHTYLCNNYKIVMIATEQNGLAIQFASDKLKNNYLIALSAVKQNGLALQYISHHLVNDDNIVLMAITQNKIAINYASFRLQKKYSNHAF